MTSTLLSPLWQDVWNDLQHPAVIWQFAAIAICIAVSWGLARVLRLRLPAQERRQRLLRLGVEGLAQALWPLLALLLLWLSRWVLGQWQTVNLLRLAIALIGAFALIRLALYALRRIFVRGGKVSAAQLLVERGFVTLVWAIFVLHISGVLPELLAFLDQTLLPLGTSKVSVLAALQAAVFVLITLIAALWFGATLEERLMGIEGMHASMRVVLARLGKSVLVVVAVLLSLSLVGIDLTVLSIFGGALGVGLGLGLQKIVSNYVAGFIILLERSISIGDVVTVDKYTGTIKQIKTRYTTVRGSDGVDAIIPNEMLLSNAVQNRYLNDSPNDRSIRQVTRVTVGYGSEIDQVLQLLRETTVAVPGVSKNPVPTVFLLNLGADGLELEIGFWIENPQNGQANVLSEVNIAILRALQSCKVNIPYPQREVRLIDKFAT